MTKKLSHYDRSVYLLILFTFFFFIGLWLSMKLLWRWRGGGIEMNFGDTIMVWGIPSKSEVLKCKIKQRRQPQLLLKTHFRSKMMMMKRMLRCTEERHIKKTPTGRLKKDINRHRN
jgi:hypothetical protein